MAQAKDVLKTMQEIARKIYQTILQKQNPSVNIPLRSLNNVKYDEKEGYFELIGKEKERTLTASTAKTFAQTLRMMAMSKDLVKNDDIATKREAYYISKNWGDAKFLEQPESDNVMDDIEAMLMTNREQIGFVPEEKGGAVAGKLVVIDKDENGKELKIDCTKFGSGAYSVPVSVEHLQFETKADFILAIETAGMFQRLVKHNYWKTANCILISMGGVPTRACRRFIRRLADDKKLPVHVFSIDGDETILIEEEGLIKNVHIRELMKGKDVLRIQEPFENERESCHAKSLTFTDEKTIFEPVQTVIRHKITEDLFEIITERGFSVKATKSHSLIVYDSKQNIFVERKPEEINKESDYAIVSLDIPNNESLKKIDLALFIDKKKAHITESTIVNKKTRKKIKRFLEGKDVQNFLRLLGYYAAEGHIEVSGVVFSFNANEVNYIEDIKEISYDLFESNVSISSPHHSEVQIRINNTLLPHIFNELGGRKATGKIVPFITYNVAKENKKEFLRGYFRGDGRVDYKEEKASVELWAKTVSKKLVYDLVLLVSQLGGTATIQHPKETDNTHEIEIKTNTGNLIHKIISRNKPYVISIANKESLNIMKEIVLELNPNIEEHLEREMRKTSKMDSLPLDMLQHYRPILRYEFRSLLDEHLPSSTFQWQRISKEKLRKLFALRETKNQELNLLKNLVNSKTTLVKIKDVKKVKPKDMYVYDIEMSSSHRFFANCICVHNTDGDPYGYFSIYRTLKVGSGNAAHINEFFCVPQAKFIGITPQDIIDYKLPTHPLKDVDKKKIKDVIKNDPFCIHSKEWQKALKQLADMGKRAEQQALAQHGLNFVISDYLPQKLKNQKTWLP